MKSYIIAGFVTFAALLSQAKDVYYVSGYFGTAGSDMQHMTIVDGDGKSVAFPIPDSDVLVIREGTANGPIYGTTAAFAYVSSETNYVPKSIRIEKDFTFYPGVTTDIFTGSTIEIVAGKTLTIASLAARIAAVGTVTFDGSGTIDLTNATIKEGIKVSTKVTFRLPDSYTGDIVITDSQNIDPNDEKYKDYAIYYDENDVAHLVKKNQAVAFVGETAYPTLSAAFDAAKPAGTIKLIGWPTTGLPAWNDAAKWQGTVQFSGKMPDKFAPSNYGNAQSTIEFIGVSGGYLVSNGSFAGTLKVTNRGETIGWTLSDGYTGQNFVFGALTGNGDIEDTNGKVKQQYSFKDGSTFGGSITTVGKKFVFGSEAHDKDGRVYVENGACANIAAGATWDGKWAVRIDGEVKGSGTLKSSGHNKVYFGADPDNWQLDKVDPIINLSEGCLTVDSTCSVVFGTKLTLKNAAVGMEVLKCASAPTNLSTVKLYDENGEQTDWSLVYEPKNKLVRLHSSKRSAMMLYWHDYRGTFWEYVGGNDVNGNHGIGRDEDGEDYPIIPGDTIVFDKTHYTDANWRYDQNLYIKQEVLPGETNDWDLKILEGATLKLGFCGASATGQNINKNFKIYVEKGSTLELGYWGNTHHKEGLLRENLTFGGAGTIKLGDDMGQSCRVKGNLIVKQDSAAQTTEIPTFDVSGKELIVEGGTIDVNLTGFGALSGSGTITTPIAFNDATINATNANGFTFKNKTTFTGTLTVDMTSAPTGEKLIKICTKGEGGSFSFTEGIDVLVRVGGEVQPAFYTLATDNDGNLCVKVAPVQISYDAEVVLGYDYKTMICRVTMTPAIDGVVATVTVNGVAENLKTWTAPVIGMRGSGRCEVMVGDADNYFVPGTYTMTVSVGGWSKALEYTLPLENGGDLVEVSGTRYKTIEEAVTKNAGYSRSIKLLTNVFFAAPEGKYTIERNGFDILPVNYTTIGYTEEGCFQGEVSAKVTADSEVVFERDEEAAVKRVVIDGKWIAAALPWRTKKAINTDIWVQAETMEMAPFEAYVLGFDVKDAFTAKLIARGVETNDPDTLEITDGQTIRSASQTGVVVTRKLIDADTRVEVGETNVLDLKNVDKVRLLKLAYDFAADGGQE